MTGPGELRTRLVLEQPVETPDGAGGVARGYASVATLWAGLVPVSAQGDLILAVTITVAISSWLFWRWWQTRQQEAPIKSQPVKS